MQIIRGDYGGKKTVIGYLKLCRVIRRQERSLKISAQKERLIEALEAAREEIAVMQRNAVISVGEEHGEIYGVYLTVLSSESLRGRLISEIEEGASSEEAILAVLSSNIGSDRFSPRHVKDCLGLLGRVLEDVRCPALPEPSQKSDQGSYIFVSDGEDSGELSLLLKELRECEKMPLGVICATATELRAAARLSLPALLIRPDRLPDDSFEGITAILDCERRRLILDPDLAELEKYSEASKRDEERIEELLKLAPLRSSTESGKRIFLFGEFKPKPSLPVSLCRPPDGADDGILIVTESISPHCSEQEQYEIYKKLTESAARVTVRLFELPFDPSRANGGDIALRGAGLFALFRQVYGTQLKALLRGAAHGRISVLLPCVSDAVELTTFRSILRESKAELSESGIPFSDFEAVGIELATPAAALNAEHICESAELAVIDLDRLTSLTADAELTDPIASDRLRSGIDQAMKLCSHAIDTADTLRTRFAVRGSLAADPRLTHSLISCGFDCFFVAPDCVLAVKEGILSHRDGEEH